MSEVSKFIPINEEESVGNVNPEKGNPSFKNYSTNLPTKPTFFTKVKNILLYEIKVELTPYEQKIEDEINEFLHQEVTWAGVKNFFLQDISFSKRK